MRPKLLEVLALDPGIIIRGTYLYVWVHGGGKDHRFHLAQIELEMLVSQPNGKSRRSAVQKGSSEVTTLETANLKNRRSWMWIRSPKKRREETKKLGR